MAGVSGRRGVSRTSVLCVHACVRAWRQASLSDARRDDQLVALDHVLQLAQVAHVVDLPAELEAAAQTQKSPPPSIHQCICLLAAPELKAATSWMSHQFITGLTRTARQHSAITFLPFEILNHGPKKLLATEILTLYHTK